MCGISGIINRYEGKVHHKEIKEMTDVIIHRGPDDEGYFFCDFFAFGHRRLSIIDLSADGHQPMTYNGKYTITYNGEVYNYLELKEELLKEGYVFHSKSDTEVILAAYDKWGFKCVNRFNGMWAFAIYDKEKNIIFCSRDRFGVKPFYYAEMDNKFVFGSEIKQILTIFPDRLVNLNILYDYLLYGMEEHSVETFFKGIYKLKQSHNLIYDIKTNKFRTEKYFNINIDETLVNMAENEAVEKIRTLLYDSVNIRLRSDVKVGTCLSGGLDSSSIAAIASNEYHKKTEDKFIAIHSKSVETKGDESEYAIQVADYCKLDLKIIIPSLDQISSYIEEVIYTQEEPFCGPSIFMQYFVMKYAKENNCKVMLDGQGGDETLFGYESYYSFYFATLIKNFCVIKFLLTFVKLKNYKLSKFLIFKSTIVLLLREKMSFLKYFLLRKKIGVKLEYNNKRTQSLYKFLTFKQHQIREIMIRQMPRLLKYEDKNSMRHSVETRLPFVDFRLVSAAVSINDNLKFKNSYLKYLLRKAVENILPGSIVWRTNKFGFEAPTDTWLKLNAAEMVKTIKNSTLLDKTIEINKIDFKKCSHLWKLYNIAVWEKVYRVTNEK